MIKPKLRDTTLFKQLLTVMSYSEALKQVSIAYANYTHMTHKFNINENLSDAFCWDHTPQGEKYWDMIDTEILYTDVNKCE